MSCLYKMCLVSYLSLIDCDPVCCSKPLVALDVIDPVLQVAVPFSQIHLKEISQQVFQIGTEVGGKSYLAKKKKVLTVKRCVFCRSTAILLVER